jgi:hypothetical protein
MRYLNIFNNVICGFRTIIIVFLFRGERWGEDITAVTLKLNLKFSDFSGAVMPNSPDAFGCPKKKVSFFVLILFG